MNRKLLRTLVLVFFFAIGGYLAYEGSRDWHISHDRTPLILGVIFMALPLAALFGINIWHKGPLDPRNDPQDDWSPAEARSLPVLGERAYTPAPAPLVKAPVDKEQWWETFVYSIRTIFITAMLVFFSTMMLLGIVFFCRIPYVIWGKGLDPSEVALRCLDWHQNQPMYLLDGQADAVKAAFIPWKYAKDIERIDTTKLEAGGYRHRVYGANGAMMYDIDSTTPHTNLTPAQIQEARVQLDRMYGVQQPETFDALLKYGETQLRRWWRESLYGKDDSPLVEPAGGTEEEKIWFAWQGITGYGAMSLADAGDWGKLMQTAFPTPADHSAAMAWAKAFHQRREQYYQAWLAQQREHGKSHLALYGPVALPPAVDATTWWILDRTLGLTETSKQTARKNLLKYFPGHEAGALDWGRKIEAERRGRHDPTPPSSDNAALICAIERLTGWDDIGVKTHDAALRVLDPRPGGKPRDMDDEIQMGIAIGYPSDDLFKMLATGDLLNLATLRSWDFVDRTVHWQFGIWILFWLILIGVIRMCLRMFLLDCIGARLLFLGNNRQFQHYYRGQTTPNLKGLIIGLVLVPLASFAWEWYRLEPPDSIMMPTPFHLLVGVYLSVLAGGLIILLINRLVAIVLIRLGFDLEKVWLDEIVGSVLGVALLAYFGNSVPSLIAFVASAVLPEAFKRWKQSRQIGPGKDPEYDNQNAEPLDYQARPISSWIGMLLGLVGAGLLLVEMFSL